MYCLVGRLHRNIHRLFQVKFNTTFINVEMKSSLDAAGLRVKIDHYRGGIGISHEESICNWRYNLWVYCMMTGARICVGMWFQYLFPCLELIM